MTVDAYEIARLIDGLYTRLTGYHEYGSPYEDIINEAVDKFYERVRDIGTREAKIEASAFAIMELIGG